MKIQLLQETLDQSLSLLQKAIPTKPQLPILASIYLNAQKDSCYLAATDLYFGVRSQVVGKVEKPGQVVIPGKQFRELVASLPSGPITLEYNEGTLTISSGKSTTTLQCYSSEEYPPFPQVEGEDYDFELADLEKIEKIVTFCASSDVARPVYTTVMFSFSDREIEVACTDSYRLSLLTVVLNDGKTSKKPQEGVYLIPAKALNEVVRIAQQEKSTQVQFKISEKLKQVLFIVGTTEIYVRLIEGDFPPYQRILPSLFTTEVEFDSQELEENIKRALIFARDTSNIIRLQVEGGVVKLVAASPSLGTFEGQLELVSATGDSGEIAFNARYLLDYLVAVKAEKVWFGMSESLKPALFKAEVEPQHRYVVMPFKVNS